MHARNRIPTDTLAPQLVLLRFVWRGRREPQQQAAFTRFELLVVLVMLAILALTLLPALARTRTDSRAFQCLNNHRELNRAWRMWSDDNDDLLLYAAPISLSASNRVWVMPFLDFYPPYWNEESTLLRSPIWPYCGTNMPLWHCPAETTNLHATFPRIRSYVMNTYLGGYSGTDANWSEISNYRIYLKFSDFNNQSPSQLFVFADSRPDASLFSDLLVKMAGYSPRNPAAYKFYQYPSALHDGAAVFSFADGRAEFHRWVDRRTCPPLGFGEPNNDVASPYNADVAWQQDRATRPK